MRSRLTESLFRPVLAGLLACLLVVSATGSITHAFHGADSDSGGHSCFVCSLVKGKVSAGEAAPIFAAFVSALFFSIPLLQIRLIAVSDRRLNYGRAPPVRTTSR